MAIVAPFRQCIWMRNIAVTVLLGAATNMYIYNQKNSSVKSCSSY